MKNKFLLLTLLIPLLGACSITSTYVPRTPYPKAKEEGEEEGGESTPAEEEEDTEPNLNVYFFASYSESEEPIYFMKWYQLKPLGACPDEAKLDDTYPNKDPMYPHFIGYSEYSSAMDETLLWDFATNYKQGNTLNLYGIWVSA